MRLCRECLAPFGKHPPRIDDTCSNCRLGYEPSSQHSAGAEVEASRLLALADEGDNANTRALYASAAKLLHRVIAAEERSSTALCNLGALYEQGRGVERNMGCAVKLYEEAAKLESATAMTNLGAIYEEA